MNLFQALILFMSICSTLSNETEYVFFEILDADENYSIEICEKLNLEYDHYFDLLGSRKDSLKFIDSNLYFLLENKEGIPKILSYLKMNSTILGIAVYYIKINKKVTQIQSLDIHYSQKEGTITSLDINILTPVQMDIAKLSVFQGMEKLFENVFSHLSMFDELKYCFSHSYFTDGKIRYGFPIPIPDTNKVPRVEFELDEQLFGSIGPCEYWGNPNHKDSINIAAKGLKKTNMFMGVELFEYNLYETLKSKENDLTYIGRLIDNDGWRVLGIHILADINKHYFLTVCFRENLNLSWKYYSDHDNEDFDVVFENILNNYKFDFYLYEGEMTQYIDYELDCGEWTDYDYINRLDSLQNEMRIRKGKDK